MPEQCYRWKLIELRDHVSVLDGKKSPTLLLTNATYLNSVFRRWMKANIWIYKDRIVYVGEKMPDCVDNCEIIDCEGQFLVPGYIEPHAHPFQLYNPHSFSSYASQFGTTTFINDNLMLNLLLDNKKAFSFIEEINHLPVTTYWWCRFDSQTELLEEETVFSHRSIKEWLDQHYVIQGGELTGWPKLLSGDDFMLYWMQEAKRQGKPIEGHFPGASEKTLAKLMLLGASCDHESMTGEEVKRRLMQGYYVSLRYSSIRPDLPVIIKQMLDEGIDCFDHCMLTTDGSPSSFYEKGVTDHLIKIAIQKGISPIDAYHMATYNIARYYHLEQLVGNIATGRIANINFLSSIDEPTPTSVLSKGKWLKKDNENLNGFPSISWKALGFEPLKINWNITNDDLQFSMPVGIKMENAVITKPYSITIDASGDELNEMNDECFFMLIDRNGKWRINTLLKGFANVGGFASSFSNTGDIILIGKRKSDIVHAFNRLKEIGGGIVLTEKNKVLHEIPLTLAGKASDQALEWIMEKEKKLKLLLTNRGYQFADPIYTLLFFSSTHLPYVRITQRGMYDVMNKMVLFPSVMR